jgi:lactate dehydrogenase-like 2-hydroxyacid dehydrogenase
MLPEVLVYPRFSRRMLEPIGQHVTLLDTQGKAPAEAFAPEVLGRVRALLTAGGQPIGTELMDALPALQAIICYGTGYDGIDLAACRARGIVLGHSPAANAAAVADLAMMLLLAATRRLLPADRYVRDGGWADGSPSPMLAAPPGLTGARLGVYGMGEIGRKIAARAAAFEMEVAYHSRSRHDVPFAYHAELGSLVDWCDLLMVAVRAGPETQHAIDAKMLARLGPQGIVVNIARGSVIDEAALAAALRDGTIAGAGLDVFAQEPTRASAFADMPQVVLTPHIGGHTQHAQRGMQACIVANLKAFFAGRPLAYPVPLGG